MADYNPFSEYDQYNEYSCDNKKNFNADFVDDTLHTKCDDAAAAEMQQVDDTLHTRFLFKQVLEWGYH